VDTIVEQDESLVDAGKTAVMMMRWRPLADRSKLNLSCCNRKGTAANSRWFDGRYDQAAGTCWPQSMPTSSFSPPKFLFMASGGKTGEGHF